MISAVQQIMLAKELKSEKQAEETLKRVKNAGYEAIELNGFMMRPSGLLVRMLTKVAGMPTGNCGKYDWKALVEASGLSVCSIQEDLGTVEREPEKVIREAEELRTRTVAITGMYRFDYTDETALRGLIGRLNAAGKKLKEGGVSLLYHNHNIEFLRLPDGRVVYDVLMEETDPSFLNFEFDSYWAADIGADAAFYMRKLGERLKMYHINDRGVRLKKTPVTPILKPDCVELGQGAMNLTELLDIAREADTEAVILECHKNHIDGSPVKSMEISAEFLKRELS